MNIQESYKCIHSVHDLQSSVCNCRDRLVLTLTLPGASAKEEIQDRHAQKPLSMIVPLMCAPRSLFGRPRLPMSLLEALWGQSLLDFLGSRFSARLERASQLLPLYFGQRAGNSLAHHRDWGLWCS